jgi:hypothetical protein
MLLTRETLSADEFPAIRTTKPETAERSQAHLELRS